LILFIHNKQIEIQNLKKYINDIKNKNFILKQSIFNQQKNYQEKLNIIKKELEKLNIIKKELEKLNIIKKELEKLNIIKKELEKLNIIKKELEQLKDINNDEIVILTTKIKNKKFIMNLQKKFIYSFF
ncbi:hypothetical protein, partial ['Cynodon dactylon' phytoplasma]|uniref:hypothetical protein n=1 Tax='Cynodon dactylon' phytoplasma TaxID=295320 RepID=UPI001BA5BF90